MSHWTYIQGTVKVTIPFGTVNRERLVDYINWSLTDMEKRGFDITGSEGPAEKFVAASRHAGTYASNDANTFERGVITITGGLRDREFEETAREVKSFLKVLVRYMTIDDVFLTVDDVVFTDHPYGKLYTFDSKEYEALEPKRDQIYRIHQRNKHRFFEQYLTLERAADIMDVLKNIGPKTMDGLLNSFGYDRVIDWEFNEHYADWMKRCKIDIAKSVDWKSIYAWFNARKYPKKLSADELLHKVRDFAYEKEEDQTVAEHRFRRDIYSYVSRAVKNEEIRKEVEKWG